MALDFGKDNIGKHTGEAGLLEYNIKQEMKREGKDTAFFDPHEIDSALTYHENYEHLSQIYGLKNESRQYAEWRAKEKEYKAMGETEEKRVVKMLEKEGLGHKVSPALRKKYHIKPKKSLAHQKRVAFRKMLAPHPARRKVKKVYSHRHGKGWHRQIPRHQTAAEKGWRRHPMRRQTKYMRTVGRKRTWSHVDLSRDRRIKAKTVRKPWQPTWRGDAKGRRV